MDIEALIRTAPTLPDQTWAQRLDHAASLLFLHGYITATQRTQITNRLDRKFEKAIADGVIRERIQPPKGPDDGE